MCEHPFPLDRYRDHDARCTTLAAELAEQLLEELSRRQHDWRKMARYALRLAEVTAQMVDLEREPGPPGARRPNPPAIWAEDD